MTDKRMATRMRLRRTIRRALARLNGLAGFGDSGATAGAATRLHWALAMPEHRAVEDLLRQTYGIDRCGNQPE